MKNVECRICGVAHWKAPEGWIANHTSDPVEVPVQPAALDVERLADLLHDAMVEWMDIFSDKGPQYAEPSWADTKAGEISAAYVRLAAEEAADG